MKEIPLTKGYVALVDDDDYERVSKHKWRATWTERSSTIYATRQAQAGGVRWEMKLHRFILNAPKGFVVDHIDRNGLNCQKSNLRLCTLSQNQANRGLAKNNTTGRKGVTRQRTNNRWGAKIMVDKKDIWLGTYNSIDEASQAYAEAAKKYFGEFGSPD